MFLAGAAIVEFVVVPYQFPEYSAVNSILSTLFH
jgi:hypothetical protein